MNARSIFVAGLGALVMAATGILTGAAGADERGGQQFQEARAATARYHSVERALADGYQRAAACVSSPAGGMGYHFRHPARYADGVVDPARPELLLYERVENGTFKLVGVEYHVDADQVTSTPVLFGRDLDGPMPAHSPSGETHYDLHVWLWKDNPNGMFAIWNPSVECR